MTYDEQKIKMGAEPVYILELDVDTCGNTYGVAPCTASGPAGLKCFNTNGTCQDLPNFNRQTKTFRFSSTRIDELQGAGDAPTFPTITGVQTAPTRLTPGKGFGIRSTLNVQLMDHPYNDVGIDQYLSDRTYNPEEQGTFWGKFLARQLFYEGREMRILTGYLADDGTYDAANFITRTYFIDTISGPTKDGRVTITGKDVLKFADNEKAQLPDQSKAELVSDITDVQTSFDISDPDDDVKNAYDGGQAYIRIDDETMLITNLTGVNPTYTLTVSRANMPSYYDGTMEAESHSAESTVQDCYEFVNARVDDILEYMLETIVGIPASFLDKSGWESVINFGFQSYLFSTLITEPIGIKDFMKEISQLNFLIWYDEREQLVKLDSLINRFQDGGPFNDDNNIIAESVSVKKDDKSRVTQTWLVYGHRNPVLELDEIKNFTSVQATVDTDAEGEDQYNLKKVKRIWSRWLTTANRSIASEIANRYNNYYTRTKTMLSISMSANDDATWTGDLITAATRQIQDSFGQVPELSYRVLEANEKLGPGKVMYTYLMESTGQDLIRAGVITPDEEPGNEPNPFPDYPDASDALKSQYAFICYDDRGDGEPGFLPDEAPYVIV